MCYKFYELATGSDAVSVLGYVCVCVAHKNKLHSCHDSHHHPHLPPVFAIKIRELFSLCLCAFGFSNCICVCGCLLAVSQSAIVAAAPSAPQFHHPHYPTPPPNFSLGSCHRLGLTGKRKHNQKDNVIMPQCGTIYTKMNTTKKKKKKINISCQFSSPAHFFAPSLCSWLWLLRFSLLLLFFATFAAVASFFFFLASKRDPLFLQLLLPFVLKGCKWLKDGAGIVEGGIVGM